MLGFPPSTEFNKRIPKQKFYENAAVPAAVKRLFADQLRCIYWRNKLAVSTLNLTAGERVTEIEIFELCLTGPKLDEAVLRQIDSEIPYHILFVLSYENKVQAWISCKDTSANSSAKVSRYLHTDWMPETELSLAISSLSLRAGMPHTALRRTSSALRNVKNCKSRLRHWRIRFGKKNSSIVR